MGDAIIASADGTGSWKLYGACSHHWCRPGAGDFSFLHALETVKDIYWNVYPPTVPEHEADGLGRGLYKRFKTNSNRTTAMINFSPPDKGETSFLSVSILLQADIAERIYGLYSSIFGRADFIHRVVVDFIGLRMPEAEIDIPSVAEFMNPDLLSRKAYFSDKVNFVFTRASNLQN
jgi:hypothetical protein